MKKGLENIKAFLKKEKKGIINILITLAAFVLLSVIAMLLLMAFDVIYFEDGMHFNIELFDSFRSSWYGWIIFILSQTVLSILLCVIPGAAMAFIFLSQAIYPVAWQAFLLSFSSVMISSTAMYLVGRFGGYKLCAKFLGEEDCAKALGLLRDKGTVFFPFMMMFPIFPDDALVMIAGTLKMSLKWFIPSIVIGRGIGIATIIFGFSIVPFDKFTSAWHWIGFIALCIILICLVFFFAFKFNKMMSARKQAKNNFENNENNSEN
ncbi:MAG: VTT domain-containing protein [Clostridia bacterium]|nr:VTT domain-containing protein [Clostridia bacterium]